MKPHSIVCETWACHEAFRRTGFSADDIYVLPDCNDGEVYVQLQAQGKEFNVRVGIRGMPVAEFHEKWQQWCVDIKNIAEAELLEIWESSAIRRQAVQLVADLMVKGFRLSGHEALN
jgi:hypothetical protein